MPRDHRRDLAMEHSLKQPLMGAAPPPPYQPMPTDPVVVRRLNYQTPGECFVVGFADLLPALRILCFAELFRCYLCCVLSIHLPNVGYSSSLSPPPLLLVLRHCAAALYWHYVGIVLRHYVGNVLHYVGIVLASCWQCAGITEDLQEATCFGSAFLEVSVTCLLLFKFHSWTTNLLRILEVYP